MVVRSRVIAILLLSLSAFFLCIQSGVINLNWHTNQAARFLVIGSQHKDEDTLQRVRVHLQAASKVDDQGQSLARLSIVNGLLNDNLRDATTALEKAGFSWERDYLFAVQLGIALWNKGETQAASLILDRAVRSNAAALGLVASSIDQSRTFRSLSLTSEVQRLFETLVRKTMTSDVRLALKDYTEIGRTLFLRMNNLPLALAWFRAAQAAYPNEAAVYFHLFAISNAQADYDSALTYLDALENARNSNVWMSPFERRLQRGGIYLRTPAQVPNAVEEFEAAVQIEPNDSSARLRLAEAYEQSCRSGDAVSQMQQALHLGLPPGIAAEYIQQRITAIEIEGACQ